MQMMLYSYGGGQAKYLALTVTVKQVGELCWCVAFRECNKDVNRIERGSQPSNYHALVTFRPDYSNALYGLKATFDTEFSSKAAFWSQ